MRPQINAITTERTNAALTTVAVAKVVQYTLIILSGCWMTSTLGGERRTPRLESEVIARWDFGASEDEKRDGWPDGWIRTTGQDFPRFIPIAIAKDVTTPEELEEIEQLRRLSSQVVVGVQQSKWPWQVNLESPPPAIDRWLERTALNPYLRIQMDGGAVELASPMVPVDDHSLYFASGKIRGNSNDFTSNIKLRFLDIRKKTLFETKSNPKSKTNEWQTVVTGTNDGFDGGIQFVQVILEVVPKTTTAFRGEFGFDAISIQQTPRLRLSVDKPSGSYRSSERITVRCSATGMKSEQPSIALSLFDHNGAQVVSVEKSFASESSEALGKLVARNASPNLPRVDRQNKYWHGSCDWVLPKLGPGYYEISTQMTHSRNGVFELKEHFAVLPDDGFGKADNRFGWTMPDLDGLIPTSDTTARLLESLRDGRVSKVKIPIWFDNSIPDSAKGFTERIDRLQAAGVQCTGVIAVPPKSIREKNPRLDADQTGQALEDSVLAQSFLEPVLRLTSLRITDFQLGWDHETDFVSNPRFAATLDSIRKLIRRYGQETFLIASHNPDIPLQPNGNVDRWQLNRKDELTEQELKSIMQSEEKQDKKILPTWYSITPISAKRYSLKVRVQDLVARMITIVSDSGVLKTSAWVANPSDSEVGMLSPSGSPRELFIPFRTMSGALAGMRNAGSLPVPSLGTNYLIHSIDEARIIAWSTRPRTAQLYLGPSVSAKDIWGREVPIESIKTEHGVEQVFEIGNWPIILNKVDLNVAKWRMGIRLVERKIDPIIGEVQELKIQFNNPMPTIASGVVRVIAPKLFSDTPSATFEMAPNETGTIVVPIQVLPDADTNESPILLEFDMGGEKPVRFSVEEKLQVGTDEFEFDITYQFDEADQLWVTVEAVNHRPEPKDFDCILLIPNRARERTQIASLKERTTRVFVIKNGSELIGQTLWLRCEQLGTKRVENKRILIERETQPAE